MDYTSLLSSASSEKWKRIGISRRAGVALPLFSIYSKNSVGIGEIPDLRGLIDWCEQTGLSIIQLLPLNEVGYDFAPYNAISTFAIEPSYLSIKRLRGVDIKPFRKELRELKKRFPKNNLKVNYDIKKEKSVLLRKIFSTVNTGENKKFHEFIEKNKHWLKYYSVFKILTGLNDGRNWQEWDIRYKYFSSLTIEKILQNYKDDINFYYWLQWQCFEQLTTIKKYAKRKKVFITGDLPFLVSKNSADVWAYKNYFKLDLSSGAPPDMYFAKGQRWGMPPYDWENIAADNFGYIKERLKYAENFYDMFRIDHFVGLFRVWTIGLNSDKESDGLLGKFDPDNEHVWEDHGKRILTVMNECTTMLPCAEDLGTVPDCSDKVLKEFGIPGVNVQRWEKNWQGQYDFIPAEDYRMNSVATVSTHDSSSLPAWWNYEAGTIDEYTFRQLCEKKNIKGDDYSILAEKLFQKKSPVTIGSSRLYWKDSISNIYVLLDNLKLNYDDSKEIVEVYLTSFGEKSKFSRYSGLINHKETTTTEELTEASLTRINSSASIFSIQLINEYLYLDKYFLENFSSPGYRINFPGIVNDINWSLRIPVSLEQMKELPVNKKIKEICFETDRIVSD
ncbi:MAG: 4-alpha-glucanotransferase [bacterium]|nr:4-alpha-glucanotransferase [bacterium]